MFKEMNRSILERIEKVTPKNSEQQYIQVLLGIRKAVGQTAFRRMLDYMSSYINEHPKKFFGKGEAVAKRTCDY